MNTKRLGSNIRAARRELGKSLTNMHNSTGLSIGGLSDIENGHKEPKLSTILKISKYLNVTVDVLAK